MFGLSLLSFVHEFMIYFLLCAVCSTSIYGFWLTLWYLQTLLIYVVFVYLRMMVSNTQHDFHIRGCSYSLAVTRGVSLLKQELITIPQPPSTLMVLIACSYCSIFRFLCNVFSIIVCPFDLSHEFFTVLITRINSFSVVYGECLP